MKLTREQQAMVSAFLRERDEGQRHLDPRTRMRNLSIVRDRIREVLDVRAPGTIRDSDLAETLERLRVGGDRSELRLEGSRTFQLGPVADSRSASSGSTGTKVSQSSPSPGAAAGAQRAPDTEADPIPTEPRRKRSRRHHPFASSRRQWLGVCLMLSEQSGYPVHAIRIGFVTGGLLAPPVALTAYLAIYIERYRALDRDAEGIPAIDGRSVGRFAGGVTAALGFLFMFTVVGIRVLDAAYAALFESSARPAISASFATSYPWVFATAFLTLVPLAVVATMPLSGGWSQTLKKVVRVCLGLFAFYLSLGLASYLAGALANAARTWAG